MKTRAGKAKAKAGSGKKAGVLAGKVKKHLPQAFDVGQLGEGAADDDDGPPEEVTTRLGVEEGVEEEADADAAPAKKPTGKARTNAKDSETAKKSKYLWEDPANQELLQALRQEDQERRKRPSLTSKMEKDGVTLLADDACPAAHDRSASDFLQEELFGGRKRKRTVNDRHDRNILGGVNRSLPLHVTAATPRARKRRAR
mmetsp:Transcript_47058/g.87988  ORF Transcript_47058/g.87988 Transcript_47058/m.87988 type:complete len:200 (-) Transcript_47058:26-625(-)